MLPVIYYCVVIFFWTECAVFSLQVLLLGDITLFSVQSTAFRTQFKPRINALTFYSLLITLLYTTHLLYSKLCKSEHICLNNAAMVSNGTRCFIKYLLYLSFSVIPLPFRCVTIVTFVGKYFSCVYIFIKKIGGIILLLFRVWITSRLHVLT